jgi:signal transduction histidine kinase
MVELSSMCPDREGSKHFLISSTGQIIDTKDQIYTISDQFFAANLAQSEKNKVVLTYTTVNLSQDFLLFGRRIDDLTIGSTTFVGLAVGVTSQQFRQNMTISLFNGVGAGYLITDDGTIFIKPDDESMVFSGYNLFSSLESGGVSKAQVEEIMAEMKTGESKARVKVDGIEWMIDIKSTQFDNDYIVVAVPLTLTAANTYMNMTLMVVFTFTFSIAIAGLMIVVIISGFRRKREEDKKAASAAAQTNFLAKMSHDIRTPLNAVNGMLQLASDSSHSREEVDGFVAKASESANYLLELVNGMLDLQKIGSGKMSIAHEPFSFSELLENIDSMYKPVLEKKGLTFKTIGADQFNSAYLGDKIKVKQIIMNLLSNAMKFTPEGGNVTFASSKLPIDSKHDEITMSVKDTGIGMSEEFMTHMFSPFEQEKSSSTSGYVGTGLGLNIVKSLTELMGGKVKVTSALGQGSTFTIIIPFEKSGTVVPTKESKNQIVPFNHQKVLLAEDNAVNQQIAVLLLTERLNLDVKAVNNGQEALEAFNASAQGEYSVILLDVRMPIMDGLEAAKAIRASSHPDSKAIPIIALSANAYEEDIRQSLAAGMNAHLAKPIDMGELSSKLHEYIK